MTDDVKRRALSRLVEVVQGLPDVPAKGIFETLAIVARVRAGEDAVAALAALDIGPRMAGLELIAANQPATPELAEVARSVLWQTSRFATLSDRHLAMWAELADELAGARAVEAGRLHETNSADRIRIYGRLLAAGVPRTTAGVIGLCDAMSHEVEVDAVWSTYLTKVRVADEASEAGLFERIRSPGARLEAICGQVQLGWRPATWTPYLAVADVAVDRADEHRQVSLARKALLVQVSGGDAARWWTAALEPERESQPAMAARVHRALLIAATCDFEVWLSVVDAIGASRLYLRDAESWLSIRCDVVRTMAAAVKDAAQVDRAHQALRELGRLSNRWYDLFHYATVARELARFGRSTEVVMAQLESWVTREGLPRPVTPVSTEEVVAPLLAVEPEAVWRWGEALAKAAPQQITWLAALASNGPNE